MNPVRVLIADDEPEVHSALVDLPGLPAALLQAVGEAVIATDADGLVIYANPVAERTYGWGPGAMLGRPIQEVTVTEETTEQAQQIMASLRDGRSWSGEFMVRRRDGSRFPAQVTDTPVYDDDGRLVAIIGISRDITERRAAQEQLAASEAKFRTLAEHSPDIIVRYDRDLRHVYVNPTVERKTGIPATAFMGKTNRELGEQPLELIELWEQTGRHVFATGKQATIDFTYPGPQGDAYFQSHMIPEVDADGTIETVLVVARDLTALHRADAQRRDASSRLVNAQEGERTRIAGDIHDDSIQVMVAAGMRLEVLKREFPDAAGLPAIMRLEQTVRNAIARLRSLMFELRPPELDREGIGSALRAYCDTAFADDTADWELIDDLDQTLTPDVRTVLYRIALEALTNVRKHTKAAHVRVILDEADHGVRLRVHDDGAGFDTADLDTVGPHHLGTVAMGERAESAGGHLDIISEQGTGTTVSVWIPTTAGATP